MNDELGSVQNEAVTTYFMVLFQKSPGGTEESHEKP
jgi:hypothetical protein